MPLQAIEPQRLYRQIAEQLRGLMSTGEFGVGSRLPAERDLAIQLGVSRPSVREALIALEVEGTIEVRTGSGIYVKQAPLQRAASAAGSEPLMEWGPLEVMSARLVVEAEVAALAAQHAGKGHIKAMRQALQDMRDQARAGQAPKDGDEAFHEAIAKACGNGVLLDVVQRFWQARGGRLFERLGAYFENPASWQSAIAEHEQVLLAIEAGDATAAKRAMQKHLRQAHKRYSASWRRAPTR
jgi:DNA-binding FadR family transcriptional regulator